MMGMWSLLLTAPPVTGAVDGEPMVGLQTINTIDVLEKMAFGLVLVIGLIFAVRFFLGKNRNFAKTANTRLVETIPFGKGRFLALVEVLDRILVIGVTEQNMNLLADIADKETVDRLRLQESQRLQKGVFKNILTSMGVNLDTPGSEQIDGGDTPPGRLKKENEILFIQSQLERIRHLSAGSEINKQ